MNQELTFEKLLGSRLVEPATSVMTFETLFKGKMADVGPFESFLNATYKSAIPMNISSYQALFGKYDEAQRTRQLAEARYPSEGISGFLGSVAGGIAPTAVAFVMPPIMPVVMAHYGLQAIGSGRMGVWSYEQRTGEDVAPATEALVALGYGTATLAAEYAGFRGLRSTINKMGQAALREIAEASATRSTKAVTVALAKHLAPAATVMGLWEGTEEGFEQLMQNALDKVYDERSTLLEGVPVAFLGGFIGGAFLAPLGAATKFHEVSMATEAQTVKDTEDIAITGGIAPEPLFRKSMERPWGIEGVGPAYRPGVYAPVSDKLTRTEVEPGRLVTAFEEKPLTKKQKAEAKKRGKVAEEVKKAETVREWQERLKKGKGYKPPPEIYYYPKGEEGRKVYRADDPKIREQVKRLQEIGLASDVVMETEEETRERARGVTVGGIERVSIPAWYSLRDNVIHLGPNLTLDTVGHEATHAYMERLGPDDPLVKEGIEKLGSEEKLSNAVGRYFADTVEDKSLFKWLKNWIRRLYLQYKGKYGEITGEQIAELMNLRMQELSIKETPRGILGPTMRELGETKHYTKEAQDVQDFFNEQRKAIREIGRTNWSQAYKRIKRAVVDASANIKAELLKNGSSDAKMAVMMHDSRRGSTTRADKEVKQVIKGTFEGLTRTEEEKLQDLIHARRTIIVSEKHPDVLEPGGLGAKEYRRWINEQDPELIRKLNPRADVYFAEWKRMLDFALAERLIGQKDYDNMLAVGDYSPRLALRFINTIDPTETYDLGRGHLESVKSSGFEPITTGTESYLYNDLRTLLTEGWSRLISRSYVNRANTALYELALKEPENGVVSVAKGPTPKGFTAISLRVGSDVKTLHMPHELALEWVTSPHEITGKLANFIGWASGAKVLRATATGYNPGFALTNVPRDLAHIWLTTQEYSVNLLRGVPQLAVDLKETINDAWYRKGAWFDAIDEGIGMTFLTHQGRLGKVVRSGTALGHQLKSAQEYLGYIGEFSEVWTRLALRNRAMKNGKSSQEATWIARNYLDFNQGGSSIKAFDAGIPYLNAGIQGTRGILRAAKQNPGVFTAKAAQLAALSSGLVLANIFNNPEAWDQVSDAVKNNYFVLTTPLYFKDKSGNKRYHYFTIAKDQGQKLLSTLFEGIALMGMGKEFDAERLVDSGKDLIPFLPAETMLAPLQQGILGYIFNKDFWRNEDIWKGEKLSDKGLEYTSRVGPAYVKLGEATGLSPVRTQYAVERLFVAGNLYSWLVGSGFNQIFKTIPTQDQEELMAKVTGSPLIRRVFRTTYPDITEKRKLDEMGQEENTRLLRQRKGLDELCYGYYSRKTPEGRAAITDYILKQPTQEHRKLRTRFLWYGRTFRTPNRQWWLEVAQMNPELRAVAYYGRHAMASPEEAEALEENLYRIPGMITKRFLRQLNLLKRPLQSPPQAQR